MQAQFKQNQNGGFQTVNKSYVLHGLSKSCINMQIINTKVLITVSHVSAVIKIQVLLTKCVWVLQVDKFYYCSKNMVCFHLFVHTNVDI